MEVKSNDRILPLMSTITKKKPKKSAKNLTPILHIRDSNQLLRKNSISSKAFLRKKSRIELKFCSSLFNKPAIRPNVSADCWVLMNLKKFKVIEAKNENTQREIASLTKIMTCITAIYELSNRGRSLNEMVVVSERAAKIEGTSAGLQQNEKLKVLDLLYALMLPSGNDAAISLAEYIGSIINSDQDPLANFISSMNKYAKSFELEKTIFNNPHGMSTSLNLSTAFEIGKMSCRAMRNPLFQTIVGTKKYSCIGFSEGKVRTIEWVNTNCLLNKGFVGVKTGTTPAAGACLCFCLKKKKKSILGVLLASKTPDIRWNEAIRLINYTNKCI